MADNAPTARAGGKKILGMKPTTAYLVFGGALLVGIVAYLIKEHQAASQAAASGTTASTGTGSSGTDDSGELSAIQSELEALEQSSGGGSSGGGGWSGWSGDSGDTGTNGGTGTTTGTTTGTGTGTTTGTTTGTGTGTSTGTGTGTGTGTTAPTGPPKTGPDPVTITTTASSSTIKWPAVGGANKYQVLVMGTEGSTQQNKTVTQTSATFSEDTLKAGTHLVKVRAGNAAGFGPWSATKTWTAK